MGDSPQILRPIPRRAFEISPPTPISTDYSMPPSPSPENQNPDAFLSSRHENSALTSRTRSILNLTSSTLLGIYSPTSQDGSQEASTPWGTGAQTPSQRRSVDDYRPQMPSLNWNGHTKKPQVRQYRARTGIKGYYLPLAFRSLLLFAFGVAYGTIITQLHKTQNITPVGVQSIDRHPVYIHIAWGLSGVLLGNALPWLDTWWHSSEDKDEASPQRGPSPTTSSRSEPVLTTEWYSAVRSIGAFVGIAFAVRKLPWQSTLQVSLTLALANPFLWYIIDRSKAGFVFSAAVGVVGTLVLLAVNPDLVPLPTSVGMHAKTSKGFGDSAAFEESIGVFTWMSSILFCTSVCFGAIGRKVQA